MTEIGLPLYTGGDPADAVINDVLKAMDKRVAKWPASVPADQVAAYTTAEFTKAVRAIHVQVNRDIAAAKAVAQLSAPEESEDDQAA